MEKIYGVHEYATAESQTNGFVRLEICNDENEHGHSFEMTPDRARELARELNAAADEAEDDD